MDWLLADVVCVKIFWNLLSSLSTGDRTDFTVRGERCKQGKPKPYAATVGAPLVRLKTSLSTPGDFACEG